MKGLGVGIAATALWMAGFSLVNYIKLAASVAEERRLAKLWCPSGDANCLAEKASHWIGASEPLLATFAIAEAISVAAVFWTVIALSFAVLQSLDDIRQARISVPGIQAKAPQT